VPRGHNFAQTPRGLFNSTDFERKSVLNSREENGKKRQKKSQNDKEKTKKRTKNGKKLKNAKK